MPRYFLAVGSLLLSGCAGTAPPIEEAPGHQTRDAVPVQAKNTSGPEEQAPERTETVPTPESVLLAALPTACEEEEPCVPPREFARATCEGRYPGMALAMFEKSTPWQRLYVKVAEASAVNTYGGRVGEPLTFTEEVLLLREQSSGQAGGLQVSGASDVDVLRWDGTCVTMRREFLSEHRMPTIKNATINWRYLDAATREGLLQAKYVKVRYEQQRTACRSSSARSPSDQCRKATEKLNDAITVAVRGGLGLPEPEMLPTWKQASM